LKTLDLPVLLPSGAEDAITAPAEPFLRSIFRNVAPPLWIAGAGHFIQEDAAEEVTAHIVRWMKESKLTRS
jgi:pimeloyl-ACP methyl ester carboxylesterase